MGENPNTLTLISQILLLRVEQKINQLKDILGRLIVQVEYSYGKNSKNGTWVTEVWEIMN